MKLHFSKWIPMSMLFFAALSAQAGVFKVVSYPFLHPKKTAHAKVSFASASNTLVRKPVVSVSKQAFGAAKTVVLDAKAVLY